MIGPEVETRMVVSKLIAYLVAPLLSQLVPLLTVVDSIGSMTRAGTPSWADSGAIANAWSGTVAHARTARTARQGGPGFKRYPRPLSATRMRGEVNGSSCNRSCRVPAARWLSRSKR